MEIKLGERVAFKPSAFTFFKDDAGERQIKTVSGTIVYINLPHRYFTVEYPLGNRGKLLRESFKF